MSKRDLQKMFMSSAERLRNRGHSGLTFQTFSATALLQDCSVTIAPTQRWANKGA